MTFSEFLEMVRSEERVIEDSLRGVVYDIPGPAAGDVCEFVPAAEAELAGLLICDE